MANEAVFGFGTAGAGLSDSSYFALLFVSNCPARKFWTCAGELLRLCRLESESDSEVAKVLDLLPLRPEPERRRELLQDLVAREVGEVRRAFRRSPRPHRVEDHRLLEHLRSRVVRVPAVVLDLVDRAQCRSEVLKELDDLVVREGCGRFRRMRRQVQRLRLVGPRGRDHRLQRAEDDRNVRRKFGDRSLLRLDGSTTIAFFCSSVPKR